MTALAWSPDGTRLATAGGDEKVKIWDPATGQTITTVSDPIGALAWSPDGTRLATASGNSTARIWDPVSA